MAWTVAGTATRGANTRMSPFQVPSASELASCQPSTASPTVTET